MLATSLEQAGAKDLLLAKTLGVVRPIRARLDGMLPDISLASLLTSSADVDKLRALFEGVFVVTLFLTVFFVPIYTYSFFSVEDRRDAVDIGLGLACPTTGTTPTTVGSGRGALTTLVARSERGKSVEQFLGSCFVKKGLNPSPIIPVKAFVFPALKESIINGKNTFQVEGVKHRSESDKILKLVGQFLVQLVGRGVHEEHGNHPLDQLRE